MVTTSELDDRETLARLASRDGDALRVLARRHAPALTRYLERLVGKALAEDALQDTLLGAFNGAGTYRGEASVKSWLFTIARHAAFKLQRRQREEPREDDDLERLGAEAGWGAETPDRAMTREQERAVLERALGELDPTDREILLLRDIEGMSGEDTAVVLGISLAAMKSRLHRARLRLVASLDNAGRDSFITSEARS